MADPLHVATVQLLHALSDQWTPVEDVSINEPAERAITRTIEAGLVEADGVIRFNKAGSSTTLVVECKWTGQVPADHLNGVIITAIPEWGRTHQTLPSSRLSDIID